MFLERLEIQGFKSFATKTTLEFGRGITAIVGPNGSGKSNVADAIRWVLGEQSMKMVRGKRAEDVIFAGSDRKTRLGAAEVSLILNNEDRQAPVDYSELVITRRVYRDGTGEYLVNKRAVRLADIQMILAKANFGQRSYSVIAQGMVDAILLTSPQDRKHFFDEAAGVRQYQLKREQAQTKLLHTHENLRQAEVLLAEIEPRLRSLTRQVRRLERRSAVEQELLGLQTTYYRGALRELDQQLGATRSRLEALERERTERAGGVNDLNCRLSAHEGEASRSEAFAGLQRQFERLQAEKGVLLAEEAVLKGQRDVAFTQAGKTNVVWLEKQTAALEQQLDDLEGEVDGLTSGLRVDESRVRAVTAELQGQQKRYDGLAAQLRTIHERLQRGAVTLPEVQSEFRELASAEEAFFNELAQASSLDQLASMQAQARELQPRVRRMVERLERIGVPTEANRVVELQAQATQALTERDQLVAQLTEAELAVRVKRDRAAQLETNRQRLRDERSRIERELARARAETKDAVHATLRDQLTELGRKIADVDARLNEITSQMQTFNAAESAKRDELFRVQRELRTAQERLNETTTKLNDVRVEVARLETRQQDVDREVREEVREDDWTTIFNSSEPTPPPTPEQADAILRVKHQLALIGGIDEGIEQEYHQTDERYTFLKTQFDDLTKAAGQLEQGIAELDRTIKARFDEAFKKIDAEFERFFKMLFRGGTARLVLVREEVVAPTDDQAEAEDAEDETPLAKPSGEKIITGIEIQATPPGKRLKGIGMLSGGERALTSIALICAIISNNPMPFAVLDEVDAALDEANSQRFAAILDQLAHKTQFVTITHNRATMEKANILYGVTMGDDGVSKLLSVKLEEAEHVIKKFGNR